MASINEMKRDIRETLEQLEKLDAIMDRLAGKELRASKFFDTAQITEYKERIEELSDQFRNLNVNSAAKQDLDVLIRKATNLRDIFKEQYHGGNTPQTTQGLTSAGQPKTPGTQSQESEVIERIRLEVQTTLEQLQKLDSTMDRIGRKELSGSKFFNEDQVNAYKEKIKDISNNLSNLKIDNNAERELDTLIKKATRLAELIRAQYHGVINPGDASGVNKQHQVFTQANDELLKQGLPELGKLLTRQEVSLVEDLNTGLTTMTVKANDVDGVTKKLILTFDRLGNIVGNTSKVVSPEKILGSPEALRNYQDNLSQILQESGFSGDSTTIKAVNNLDKKLVEVTATSKDAAGNIRKLKVAFDELGNVVTPNKFNASNVFGNQKAIDNFRKNLGQALAGTGLGEENIVRAVGELDKGLVKISLSSGDASTGMEKLNIAFDRQGNIVQDVKTKHQGFLDAIQQNIVRAAKWAVAAQLVYRALSKLEEIPQVIVEIDAEMARLAATTGISKQRIKDFYSEIAKLAAENRIDLSEALGVSSKAFRATDSPAEAINLMDDAMLYAQLSGENLDNSLEKLIGTINQLGLEFDQSESVMAKWASLSRVLNVDMNSFGTVLSSVGDLGLSLLSENAEEATDELNAMIAVLSDATSRTPARMSEYFSTLFTNLRSNEEELKRFGIYLKDATTGQYRDIFEVLDDISVKYFQGDNRAAQADISQLIGGGGRGASDTAALLSSWEKVLAAQERSANADEGLLSEIGETLDDNLKTDLQETLNVYRELIMTIADEGGIDTLKTLLEGLQTLGEILQDIVEITGEAGFKFAGMYLAMSQLSKLVRSDAFVNTSKNLASSVIGSPGSGTGISGIGNLGTNIKKNVETNIKNAGMADVGLGIAASIISGVSTGLETGSWEIGVAQSISTAIGSAIGLALGGPGGLILGSQVGNLMGNILLQGAKEAQEYAKSYAEFSSVEGFTAGGGIDEVLAGLDDTSDKSLGRVAAQLVGTKNIGGKYPAEKIAGFASGGGFNLSSGDLKNLIDTGDQEQRTASAAILSQFGGPETYDEIRDLYLTLQEARDEVVEDFEKDTLEAVETQSLERTTSERQSGISQELERRRNLLTGRASRKLFTRLTDEEDPISKSDYNRISEGLSGSVTFAEEKVKDIKDAFETFEVDTVYNDIEKLFDLITFLPEGEATFIGKFASQISDLISSGELEEAEERTQYLQDLLTQAEERMIGESAGDPFELPSYTDVGDLPREDFDKYIEQYSKPLQKNYARMIYTQNEEQFKEQGFSDFESWYEGFVESLESQPVLGEQFMTILEGLDPMFIQWGLKTGQEMSEAMEEGFNIRRLKDLDPSKIPELESANRYWVEYLANIRGQSPEEYLQEEGEDMNLILGEENVFHKILSTNEAMNFVLQDILETEKKQLEGVWNIPDGATFWVPITSLFNQTGGGGGYPNLPPLQDVEPRERDLDLLPDILKDVPGADLNVRKRTPEEIEEENAGRFKELMDLEEDTGASTGVEQANPREILAGLPKWVRAMDSIKNAFSHFIDWGDRLLPRGPEDEVPQTDIPESSVDVEPAGEELDFMELMLKRLPVIQKGPDGTPMMDEVGERTAMQEPTINVNVPEPDIRVESTLNAVLQLDGRVVSRLVKKELSRELSRLSTNRRHTVPGRV